MGGLVADFLGYRAPFWYVLANWALYVGIYLFMPNLQFKHKVDDRVAAIS